MTAPRLARAFFFFAFIAASAANAPAAPAARPPQFPAPDATLLTAQRYPEGSDPTKSAIPGPSKKSPETYTLSPERYEKAVSYSRHWYTLYFVSTLWGILVILALLRFGVPTRLRSFAEKISESRPLQCVIFVPIFVLLIDLLDLPLRLYWHSVSLHYQQSKQGWASWFWDWSKEELLGIGLALILIAVLFRVIRWKPRTWWFYYWLAALPILLFFFFISPWFIDPLFNKFEPLESKSPALVQAMDKVIARTGLHIPHYRMFWMQASQKTNQINAYVTGFGASKRVVVWDTTIQKTTVGETLFIFGHECGHYVLGHIRDGFLFFSAGLLLALFVGYRALHGCLDRWGSTWKIYGQADWAALAVMALLLQIMTFLSAPIANGFSRMIEHAADVYGLEVTHGILANSDEVAAEAFQVLGEEDLSDPNPPEFITFWLYSHPPLGDRLIFAHTYDPWSKGESPKYVK